MQRIIFHKFYLEKWKTISLKKWNTDTLTELIICPFKNVQCTQEMYQLQNFSHCGHFPGFCNIT